MPLTKALRVHVLFVKLKLRVAADVPCHTAHINRVTGKRGTPQLSVLCIQRIPTALFSAPGPQGLWGLYYKKVEIIESN